MKMLVSQKVISVDLRGMGGPGVPGPQSCGCPGCYSMTLFTELVSFSREVVSLFNSKSFFKGKASGADPGIFDWGVQTLVQKGLLGGGGGELIIPPLATATSRSCTL